MTHLGNFYQIVSICFERCQKMKQEFPYFLWLQSAEKKEKEREKIRKDVLLEIDKALKILAKHYYWDDLYLFGSIIKAGKFMLSSDIDIAILGLNKLDYFAFVGDISAILNRTVDVVNLEDCYFGNSIVSGGVRWISKKK